MNNSTNTLPSIKLSLQVELPKLPSKLGIFDSFGGQITNYKLKFNFLQRHINRFNYGLNKLAEITNKDCFEHISLDFLITKLELLFKETNPNEEYLSNDSKFRFRLWTDLSQIHLDAAPFNSRFTKGYANLASYKLTRNLPFKYTPARESIESIQLAISNNLDEGLLVDDDNNITESSWSNFLWIEHDEIICASGLGLDGITQQVIEDLYSGDNKIIIKPISLNELLSNQFPCFLTNSLEGVIKINSIDGIKMKFSSQIDNIKRCYDNYCLNNEVTWIQIDS